MRKLWALSFTILMMALPLVYITAGAQNPSNNTLNDGEQDGGLLIYLGVPDGSGERKLSTEMLIIDQKGRKTGKDLKQSYNEIPQSKYYIQEPKDYYFEPLFELDMETKDGCVYQLQIIGKKDGLYSMRIDIVRNKGDRKTKEQEFDNVKIRKGEVHNYTLKFSLTAPMEIKRVK
jgi:hypothetical protein